MNKVAKFQIIKPINMDWQTLGKILNELQYETRNVKNKAMQLAWEYQGFSSDYKKEYEKYPSAKEVLKYSGIMGYAYDKLKTEYTKLNSGNQSQSIKTATDKWNTDRVKILKGEISIPSWKRDCPLDVTGNTFSIKKQQNEYGDSYVVKMGLISNSYKKELGLAKGQAEVIIKVGDNSRKQILDRVISGQYKQSASQLIKKKNKWFLNLSYGFEKEKAEGLDENKIMGVDMGIIYPLYMAFNSGLQRYKIKGGEIEQFRKQVVSRKNELLEQGMYCGEGRIGHGIKTRIKPINFAQDKITNFRDTTNHKYSKYVIDMAIRHNCGVIQMEDLTGIASENMFLKNWSYYDLQQKIKYKAEEKGIVVVKIKPDYTSQRCNKCGFIHKDNRPDQKTFKCLECDLETNADFNAAKNIATQDIEKIIEEQIKKQKEEGTWKTLKKSA